MTEAFLQYIWKHKLFETNKLFTTNGEAVIVHSTGQHNFDAGPDFFDARLTIGNTLWAGNVEIHINASDWNTHKHTTDKAYNNVILHLVYNYDTTVKQENGQELATAVLSFPKQLLENYQQLLASENWIACEKEISSIDPFSVKFWLGQLTIKRLERKTLEIERILIRNTNNWEETFYQQLSRSFGSKVNVEPFEQLAISVPQNLLAKNKNNLQDLEAILFGQAGFLSENAPFEDTYFKSLKSEYHFFKNKYGLKPLEKHQWKFMRLRPANFPTIRIAQLASLIFNSQQLFSKIKEAENLDQIRKLFNINISEYWKTHYRFFKSSKPQEKTLGKSTLNSILINTIVPILFAYGRYVGEHKYCEKALAFWEEIDSEKNNIIDKWKELGVQTKNASDSQALIELKNEFCDKKNCLNCTIGNKLVNR